MGTVVSVSFEKLKSSLVLRRGNGFRSCLSTRELFCLKIMIYLIVIAYFIIMACFNVCVRISAHNTCSGKYGFSCLSV